MKKALAMEIRIEKDLGDFRLDLAFSSDCRRIGILGASGCGKSLTLKCIAGIETPDRGRIQICSTPNGGFHKNPRCGGWAICSRTTPCFPL